MAEFLAKHVDLKTATGLSRVVRHGHLPEREVMTGIGPVDVRQPRVRDRGATDDAGRIRFTPAILPPYARRSRSLEVLIPILYLKGISTGDFEEALAALRGKDAPGLSASTIARLKEVLIDEHEHWRKRDLSAKHYVPNTGNTCGPRTRSRAPLPPCGTARSARRAASRIRRRSPWCSSWSMRRRKAGAGSMATTSCPSSFKVSGSPTGSKSPPTPPPRNPKPPPPDPLRPSPRFGDSCDGSRGTARWVQISAAKSGCALPSKTAILLNDDNPEGMGSRRQTPVERC